LAEPIHSSRELLDEIDIWLQCAGTQRAVPSVVNERVEQVNVLWG
jgi:hypothetical protein